MPKPVLSQVKKKKVWHAEEERPAPLFVVPNEGMPTSSDKAAAAPAASALISLAGAKLLSASCSLLLLRLGLLLAAGAS